MRSIPSWAMSIRCSISIPISRRPGVASSAIDLAHPARAQWHTVIPEHHDTLAFATMVNNQLVVAYMHDACHLVQFYDLDGVFLHDMALPTMGSIVGLAGKRTESGPVPGISVVSPSDDDPALPLPKR